MDRNTEQHPPEPGAVEPEHADGRLDEDADEDVDSDSDEDEAFWDVLSQRVWGAPQPPGPRWGEQLSDERKAELRALAERQRIWAAEAAVTGRGSVFVGMRLTGADVFWLAVFALAGADGDVDAAERSLRNANSYADLSHLHLESADLTAAHLEGARLYRAHLERAKVYQAHLDNAMLSGSNLAEAIVNESQLPGAFLSGADLRRAQLIGTNLRGATINQAHLDDASLDRADLHDASLLSADLHGAKLPAADLRGAKLRLSRLEQADLSGARLHGADLSLAHLEGTNLSAAQLEGATLSGAFMDTATNLDHATLHAPEARCATVVDVRWGGVNLAVLAGTLEPPLGDELTARTWKPEPFVYKPDPRLSRRFQLGRHMLHQKPKRVAVYETAVRANRQFAIALQGQALDVEAARFFYRARVLERTLLRLSGRRAYGRWIVSCLLDAVCGYGYRPARTLLTYLLVVLAFAAAYWLLGPTAGQTFAPGNALVFSLTTFHGRGFFPNDPSTRGWIAWLTLLEAVLGLVLELTFLAAIARRFFTTR